jgi:protocatechuate 3,4-dioxygenase beta subunit
MCLAVLAALGVVSAEPPSPPNPTGSLVVRVSAVQTPVATPPRPVAGAVVVVSDENGERARTGAGPDGTARFPTLPASDYTVRAEADHFVAEEKDVTIDEGKQASLSFDLSPGVSFDGTVLDDEAGTPVKDAAISVEARGGDGRFMSAEFRSPYATATSDAQGKFHVNGVPEGKVATVEVVATGHAAGAFSLRIIGGHVTPSPVVIRLSRGGTVSGVVRDPAGRPVSGATVYVVPAASEELRQNPKGWRMSQSGVREQAAIATTGADGRYRVSGLALDVEYVAVAEAEGFHASLATRRPAGEAGGGRNRRARPAVGTDREEGRARRVQSVQVPRADSWRLAGERHGHGVPPHVDDRPPRAG